MRRFESFGHWTATKAALAVAGVLAIGGAVGSAIAMSPIVQPPIKWGGGMEFNQVPFVGGPYVMYVVPAGRNLILTDLVIGNLTGAAGSVFISSGSAGGCFSATMRMNTIVVPAGETTSVSLQTGIGFTAGSAVCIQVFTSELAVNGRGFLFTPAPAG